MKKKLNTLYKKQLKAGTILKQVNTENKNRINYFIFISESEICLLSSTFRNDIFRNTYTRESIALNKPWCVYVLS